jgi:hypothetical protein
VKKTLFIIFLACLAGCKKGESFDGFFGIQSTVVYTTNCSSTYFASYRDNNGNVFNNDFQVGNKTWTVKMNSGKTADITINTFGAEGSVSITINDKEVASKSVNSKSNVDLSYVVP